MPGREPKEPTPFVETLKICGYAKTGSKKTVQIGHLIDLVGVENVLIVSAEGGLGVIESKLTVPENVVKISTLDDYRANWTKVKGFCHPDRWVAIDGGTQIADWIGNEQLSGADSYYDAKARGQSILPTLLPFGKYTKGDSNNLVMNTMQVYGRIGRDIENAMAALKSLPVNLYMNFWEDMTESDGFKAMLPWGPDVPGKVGLKAVIGAFDFVLRFTVNGDILTAQTRTDGTALAKTREDRFAGIRVPSSIKNFELGKFIKLVRPTVYGANEPAWPPEETK